MLAGHQGMMYETSYVSQEIIDCAIPDSQCQKLAIDRSTIIQVPDMRCNHKPSKLSSCSELHVCIEDCHALEK